MNDFNHSNEKQRKKYELQNSLLSDEMERFRTMSAKRPDMANDQSITNNYQRSRSISREPKDIDIVNILDRTTDKSGTSVSAKSLETALQPLSKQVGILSFEELTELNQKVNENKNFNGSLHPYVKEWLQSKVFLKYPVNSKETFRQELPVQVDPKDKLKILKLVKDLVGKDITKIALPCYLNEPIGALHKACEVFSFKSAFDRAVKTEDTCLRLGLTMAANFMNYSGFIGKGKKPFNPLLGETHEFFWEDARLITEQVSHHPPITASYAETDDYSIQGKSPVK